MRDTLVIIDDNELDLAILNEIFKSRFQVKCFSNAPKAVSFLQQNESRITTILLDICLGRTGTGFSVLEHIHSQKSLKNIPIILMTSDAHESYVREGIELGAIDFLAKPVDPHAVTKRVFEVVKRVWPEDELSESPISEENSFKKSDIEYSEDEIKLIAKSGLDKMYALGKLRNVISVSECSAISKITMLLAQTYVKTDTSNSLSEVDAHMIGYAATFYDIGRLGIPDAYMQSDFDTNLSDTYANHINIGYDYFNSSHTNSKFNKYCAEIAYWHHKNIDGSGYPANGSASDIPISAQLVRTSLRFYAYADKFKNISSPLESILSSLSSEINNTISYQMYDLLQKSRSNLEILLKEIFL